MADMWWLPDVTQELNHAGCSVGTEPTGPREQLPKDAITEMLNRLTWDDRGSASKLQLAKKVLDGQLSFGNAHLDSFIFTLQSNKVVERTGGKQGIEEALGHWHNGTTAYLSYNYIAKVRSLEQFAWLLDMIIYRRRVSEPDCLQDVASAVEHIRKDLHAEIQVAPDRQKARPDTRSVDARSEVVISSCLTSLVEEATDMLSLGHLSQDAYDGLIRHIGHSAKLFRM